MAIPMTAGSPKSRRKAIIGAVAYMERIVKTISINLSARTKTYDDFEWACYCDRGGSTTAPELKEFFTRQPKVLPGQLNNDYTADIRELLNVVRKMAWELHEEIQRAEKDGTLGFVYSDKRRNRLADLQVDINHLDKDERIARVHF